MMNGVYDGHVQCNVLIQRASCSIMCGGYKLCRPTECNFVNFRSMEIRSKFGIQHDFGVLIAMLMMMGVEEDLDG